MSNFASFDAFGSSQQQNNDFDPFGSGPSPQTSQRKPQSQPNAFEDFSTMGQALPSQAPVPQQQRGHQAVQSQSDDFADFFNSGTAKPLNTQQQRSQPPPPQQQQPDLFSNGSFAGSFDHTSPAPAPPAFSHQTSSEFDSIFGGGTASAPSPQPTARQATAPAAPVASFDAFSSDPNPTRPRHERRETNTSFDDFFNSPPQQPSIVESKRFSVGGTFHAQDLNLSPVSDDEEDCDDEDSDDGVMEAADPSMFHPPPRGAAGPQAGASGGRKYSVLFETEKKLGMLLERHDEWVQKPGGVGKLKECTVVKLIVEHGAADVKGVSLGSRVVAVNEHDCQHRPYLETLNLVKTTPRPMKVVLQEGKLADDECISGYCLLRKSVGPIPPSSFVTWKRRYFVLGGAVANKNVLQVYKSKRDYEHVVVSLFERKPIHVKLKAYKLSPGFSISALKSVRYSEVGANVFYFTLMTPQAKFKMIKFGSDNADQMRDLHQNVTRFTGVQSSTW